MKCKAVVSLLALVSIFGVVANAQEGPTKFDVFAGYSYVRAVPSTKTGNGSVSLNGGSASFAYHFSDWLSGVVDFGAYHTWDIRSSGVNGTLSTYLLGPRFTYHRFRRMTPFGQVLFGGSHAGTAILNLFSTDGNLYRTVGGIPFSTSSSENAFAMNVGGGVDYKVSDHLSIRTGQVDYLLTRFNEIGFGTQRQNNLRVSGGVVLRF